MKTIIISAVNLTEGGTLSILRTLLHTLSVSDLCGVYKIVALVNDKHKAFYENIEYIELPKAKKRWVNRIYYEYYYFKKISTQYDVFLWFSLHDMSPNVIAQRKVVYMHNPSPFFKWNFKDLLLSKKYVFFAVFYQWVYRINIHKNDYLIVQQEWLRQAFSKMFDVDLQKIIVATPQYKQMSTVEYIGINNNARVFFFPALARPFKNFEVICEAVLILNTLNINDFEVILTIDGSENRYSRDIFDRYGAIPNLKFVGLLKMEQMPDMYLKSDVLIFPSKLETWGLPISEFREYRKPMIIADLEYAHETSSGSLCTAFFNPNNAQDLAELMRDAINSDYVRFSSVPQKEISSPSVGDFCELMNFLLK